MGGSGREGCGKVYIVGGGPGDPDLITVKALKTIMEADVIIYDRLAPHGILNKAKDGAELIYVGKEPGGKGPSQDYINNLLLAKACEGKTVVRLKGGDPYTYGRGEEECMFLIENGVECEVVPGIPSYIAAAALHGVPLTSRGVSSTFAVVPGREAEHKPESTKVRLEDIASAVDTIVILMGASRARELARRLMKVLPPDTPVAIAINVSLPNAKTLITDLATIASGSLDNEIKNPAVIIVGNVVKLREKLYKAA